MKRIISFPLEDGKTILVEVNTQETYGGQVPAGRETNLVDRATQTFDQALDTIKPAAEAVINKLRSISEQPDEVEVTFGVKLTAEAGAIIAAASAEANYEIKLTWKTKAETEVS